ncbi:MAG: response regulator [Candidatus Methanoperedens sp.]|nr:response regulator [Candidatus Methanoperedens sp.]
MIDDNNNSEKIKESMNKPRILVVDDEPMNVEIFEGYLSGDYDVIKAYNGDEALLKVETTNPDLILLDVMMPGKNGFDVCKILKDNPKTMAIPIIFVTALNEKEDRIKALEAGADDFLSKPIDIIEVTARVKSLLRIKQYYDALMGDYFISYFKT